MSTPSPSFRLPVNFPSDVHPAVKDAFRLVFQALNDHEQAFVAVNSKIATPAATTTAPTVTTPTVTVSTTGPQVPSSQAVPVGGVNDQTGATSYILQQSDYGGLVIMNSGSPVAVTANANVTKPFFTKIWNNGSGTITVTVGDPGGTPTGQTINGSASITIGAGVTKSVYLNSADFNWSAV